MLAETSEVIQGQRQSWSLIRKLGEGDAGEVYLVESLLDHQPAIVKRPRRGAFFSDILRQASQIKTEGSILRGLPRAAFAKYDLRLNIPALIDQNKPEFGVSEQTFIVIDQARGLDLKILSQIMHFGPASIPNLPVNPEVSFLVQQWSRYKEFPAQLLVRILLSVINLLETIHTTSIRSEQGAQSGVIWNDVKPDHLYWDGLGMRLTVIDWGNSQFLESDGVTKDRQYSAMDDFRQYLHEMGSYLSKGNPELYNSLEWPEPAANNDIYVNSIQPLKEKLVTLQETHSENLQLLRKQEIDLYDIPRPELDQIVGYEKLHQQLAAHGELPDKLGGINFLFKAAYQMAVGHRLAEFQEVCDNAAALPTALPDKWKVLSEIANVAQQSSNTDEVSRTAFSNALADGVADDWTSALWELFTYIGNRPQPDWWEKISQEARKVCLGLDAEAIPPYTMFARLYYTLRSEVSRKGEQRLQAAAESSAKNGQEMGNFHWQASEELVATVQEEIIKKWKEIEPSPPNSGIGYSEVDSLIDRVDALIPGTRQTIEKSMTQLKSQVDLVLSAWEQKDFELARRGLRLILVWDPDRARLITAEKAIDSAAQWLAKVHNGAGKDEPFYDFLTSVELAGRTLRNQVGPAKWLDETLEAFKRLRKGARSVDLMIEYPDILHELPWLNEYQSREILSLPHIRPISLERDSTTNLPTYSNSGVVDGKFGPEQAMTLAEPLDTWLPEARGSSARVFAGTLYHQGNHPQTLAFKIMRPNQADYALPLFIEEVQILTMLRDVPGITPMVECGYIKINDDQALPTEETHASAERIAGQVIHYGVEQAQNFLASMDRQLSAGWIPFLALEKRNPEHNLLHYCDASFTHGWFLSLRDSLVLALQICDILQFAHDRNIVYRDHKILHYYWDVDTHGVSVIDWNIAKRHPQGLSDEEKQFDLVQFGARGLHHIFTGRSAQGSLALGPNRPEDIEKASTHYPVNWTYDDERLPNQLRAILETSLNQGYTQVRVLRQDLLNIYQQLPSTDKN
ncbi:MAG TPA: serine/threonine-protein kinase [Anaerolineales bacterium]|nr:serine/threonine-protein kinase [Anaerolineales bacterium]